MFDRFGLTAHCLGCRAIRTVVGDPANHTERCRELIERELEKEPEGASKVARENEIIKRAQHEERARDKRIENPSQQPDMEEGGGSGASSSLCGPRVEPPAGPPASSASADLILTELSDDTAGELRRASERVE